MIGKQRERTEIPHVEGRLIGEQQPDGSGNGTRGQEAFRSREQNLQNELQRSGTMSQKRYVSSDTAVDYVSLVTKQKRSELQCPSCSSLGSMVKKGV